MTGADVFKKLLEKGFLSHYEWSNLDDFSKFLAIMQNAKWAKTQKSLENLKNIKNIQDLALVNKDELANLIKPSGFYNTKAKQMSDLANAILKDFGDFESFLQNASYEWLINIKGIGWDTTASLLNHLCKKPFFVINANARKLVDMLGYEAGDYYEANEILSSGLDDEYFYKTLNVDELAEIYTIFNATIDNFLSTHFKNKELSNEGRNIIMELL